MEAKIYAFPKICSELLVVFFTFFFFFLIHSLSQPP
jgi:hypothetical protein